MHTTVALFWMSWLVADARPPAPGVVVRGDTPCPTSGEVSAALVGLLAHPGPAGAPDLLRLLPAASGSGAGVMLVLTNAAGELVARREVAADARSCAELARTAAVIVAAWEARLATGGHPTLPVTSPLPPAPTNVGDRARGGGRGSAIGEGTRAAEAPPEVASPPPGGPDPGAVASGSTAPAASGAPLAAGFASARARGGGEGRAIDIETGAAFLASVASATASLAPGALAEVTLSRRDSPGTGLGLGVLAVGTHATELMAEGAPIATSARARGAWRRVGGVLDVRSRSLRSRVVELDLRLGLALTALALQGQSLPVVSGATLFDPGMLVGVRVLHRFGQVAPFLELAAATWPRGHTMYVGGAAISADVPPFEGWLSVGICVAGDR